MLSILDRYIIKKFLGTFLFIITLLMTISVVFDISERIDDFMEGQAPFWDIVIDYYLNFVIFYGNLFSSLLIFISVIWFTSKMAYRSEIIAILAGGISFRRMLRPYFLCATFLTLLALLLNHFVVPYANKGKHQFMVDYVWTKFRIHDHDLHREMEPGTLVYVEHMNMDYLIAYKFSIEKWQDGRLTYKLITDRAVYNDETKVWTLKNYFERYFKDDGSEEVIRGISKDTTFNVKPRDFGARHQIAGTLDYFELNDYIAKEKMKGSPLVTVLELEKHQRTSYPVATFILVVIAVSLSSRRVRGGMGLHIASGILTAVIYIFFMKIASVSATNAGVDPFIAVWIPNLIFGVVAVILYRKTPK